METPSIPTLTVEQKLTIAQKHNRILTLKNRIQEMAEELKSASADLQQTFDAMAASLSASPAQWGFNLDTLEFQPIAPPKVDGNELFRNYCMQRAGVDDSLAVRTVGATKVG
jgi:hypothetical protein